jgi:endonuclease YncB( thermonuclease family)
MRTRGLVAAAVLACVAVCRPMHGEESPDAGAASVSAWATGGGSAAARPGESGSAAGGIAQATPWPAYVIQGGTIPPDWKPQPIPINGIGPDGRPTVHYYAPTYTFTYQIGPPVFAVPPAPVVNRASAAYQQPAPYQYAAGPYPPAAYAPNYYPPNAYPTPVNQSVAPPTIANYAPAAAAPVPQQALVPMNQPADGWASAQSPAQFPVQATAPAAQQPPPLAAVAMPLPPTVPVQPAATVPPVVPVPQGIPVQPVSSAGLTPAAPATSRAANSHLWRVIKVYDGDTVTCLDDMNQQQKVRLAEIDAPEASQDFGQVSRQTLAGMVFGKTIEVVDQGRDRYGRWIGRLYADGIDVNQQMVATGNAWHYAAYSKDPALAQAQTLAQAQRIGLWSQPNPTPPWEYRKTEKSK